MSSTQPIERATTRILTVSSMPTKSAAAAASSFVGGVSAHGRGDKEGTSNATNTPAIPLGTALGTAWDATDRDNGGADRIMEEEDAMDEDPDEDDDVHRHSDTDEDEFADLFVDIAEDAAIATDDRNEGLSLVERENCECNLSRHFTACQFVRGLRMWKIQAWAEVLREKYGLRGYRDLRGLRVVDSAFLAKEFKALLCDVEDGTPLQATVLAYAVRRVKGRLMTRV